MAESVENDSLSNKDVLPQIGEGKSAKDKHRNAKLAGALIFGAFVFTVPALIISWLLWPFLGWPAIIVAVIVGTLLTSSTRIAYEWERVVILRFGHFSRIATPGLYFTIPIIEQVAMHVDQRINTTSFLNEHALTADLAPVDVDAVVFWMVWDPKAAYTQVVDYPSAVSWSAQTALRDAIGQIDLTDVPIKRTQIDHEVQEQLERKVSEWGISIISVEIRDIAMPEDLQNAMSRAAQAERERDARIILAEAEKEVSNMFVEASGVYREKPEALQLRIANLLYESLKNEGGLVVVPSSFADSASIIEKTANLLKHS